MKHFLPEVEPERLGYVEFDGADPYPVSFSIQMTDGTFVTYDKRTVQPRPHLFDGLMLFERNYDQPRKHEKK